jgi:hypothetical protein
MGQMSYDINKILAEYGDDDFGFSTVDEVEYQAVIAEKDYHAISDKSVQDSKSTVYSLAKSWTNY